jgi:preprotein translocase subunit Sec63
VDTPTIVATYRKLAREWHPDKNQHRRAEAERIFSSIAHAYDILKNDVSRRDYNYALKHPEKFAYNQYRYYYSQYYVKHMQVCTEIVLFVVVLLLSCMFHAIMQKICACQAGMRNESQQR